MATVQYFPFGATYLYAWRAWNAALNAAGMTRTADTGQTDPAVTSLAVTYPNWVEIRTFQDYYIKFSITTSTGNKETFNITIGTGSDGSGNITGTILTNTYYLGNDSGSWNSFTNAKVIYSENHVTLALWDSVGYSYTNGFSFGVIDPGTSVETPVFIAFPANSSGSNFWNESTIISTQFSNRPGTDNTQYFNTQNLWWPGYISSINSPVADQYPLFPLYAWRMDGQAVKIPWMKAVHFNAPLIYEYQSVTVDGDTWQLPADQTIARVGGTGGALMELDYYKPRLKLVTRIAES